MMPISYATSAAKQIAESIESDLKRLFPYAEANVNADIGSPAYWLWMCQQIADNWHEWDDGKLHRWVGYLQGMLNATGVTSLDEERERVRKFKP